MPIIKSAIKRMKQTATRRERNIGLKKDIKLATKALMANPTAETLSKAQSTYDIAVKKNLYSKQTVARRKSALHKYAKEAGVKLETAKKAPAKAAAKTAEKPAAKKPAVTTAKKPVAAKTPAKKPAAKTASTAKKAPAKK